MNEIASPHGGGPSGSRRCLGCSQGPPGEPGRAARRPSPRKSPEYNSSFRTTSFSGKGKWRNQIPQSEPTADCRPDSRALALASNQSPRTRLRGPFAGPMPRFWGATPRCQGGVLSFADCSRNIRVRRYFELGRAWSERAPDAPRAYFPPAGTARSRSFRQRTSRGSVRPPTPWTCSAMNPVGVKSSLSSARSSPLSQVLIEAPTASTRT